MHNLKRTTYGIVILLLAATSYGFAEEDDCDFNFKGYEEYILKAVPPSSILSRKSNKINAEVLLKVEGVQDLTLAYGACYHYGLSIKARHVEPPHLGEVLDFIKPIISEGHPRMGDIFEGLKSYIMTKEIIDLNINNRYLSSMSIKKSNNDDGTINIEISVSGG